MPVLAESLHTFLKSLPTPCVVVDMEGRLCLANGAAEGLFGAAPGALRGVALAELVPERFRGRVPVPGSDAWRTAPPRLPQRCVPAVALRRDGSECAVEIDLTPLTDDAGRPQVAALIRDVSRQVRDREQMLLHLSDVAHASRLSTMGEMVAGLAHEG
jgi:PAS domain S-box-containing protein